MAGGRLVPSTGRQAISISRASWEAKALERNQPSGSRKGSGARKRAGRRARGLEVKDRDDVWHVSGTLRVQGNSVRLRKSLGLSATAENYDAAWDEARRIEKDLRAEAAGETPRGDPVVITADAYLALPRERPLGATTIRIIREIIIKFGARRLNDIPDEDWKTWVDARQIGNSADTRERFLNCVIAFQSFAVKHHKLKSVTTFNRDKKARNPRRRKRRRIGDLRPDLIWRLLGAAHVSLRAQLAAEWSTGARVSSILFGARICDVNLGVGREAITFRSTKNGQDVTAALHPTAADILRDYAKWRGNLRDREAHFFLTYRKRPYRDNGRDGGGQNKTGFNAAKRRARRDLLADAFAAARAFRKAGDRGGALDRLLTAKDDARLLRRLTQHWFRHLLATRMRGDLRAGMEQGGWLDERSIMGYIHDVPAARRAAVDAFEDIAPEQNKTPRVRNVP
jgi:hypothetical protein